MGYEESGDDCHALGMFGEMLGGGQQMTGAKLAMLGFRPNQPSPCRIAADQTVDLANELLRHWGS